MVHIGTLYTDLVRTKDKFPNGYTKLPPIVEEAGTMRLDEPGGNYREDASGHLLCWGCGEFGQHGHGYKKEVPFLDAAVEMFCGARDGQVKHVGCGASHTAVVTKYRIKSGHVKSNNNDIYVWGNGNSGQLGHSDLATKLEPQRLPIYGDPSNKANVAGVACGGRHTMVWLDSGHVFSFGNNYHAQLGFDFREKQYKQKQTQPTLLRILTHRPVGQVACGDKHTVFRFKDGGLACVGSNSHGQIGCGDKEDALSPKFCNDVDEPIRTIAAGSQHTLAVTESGDLYVWGYGKACGTRTEDVLSPQKLATHRRNVVDVAGGSSHSMALTANGSVYTWGCGTDGQLGHGEKVRYLTRPRRVKDRHVTSKCIQISCGETFSAAITEKGLLYMWGKNSHTIVAGKPTSYKVCLPHGVNKNFRGGRIDRIICGSWHAIAIIGRPELLIREDEESGESEQEMDAQDVEPELEGHGADSEASDSEAEPYSRQATREAGIEREKTTVSIADFYAPTPDLNTNVRSPSPEFYYVNKDQPEDDATDLVPNTSRSTATIIVQLPKQPPSSYADAACSPMTLTTTSSNNSSSITTLSRVPSPVQDMFPMGMHMGMNMNMNMNMKFRKKPKRPEKKFKEFDPQKYEREKMRNNTPVVSEVVQLSKTPADSFILPREPTGFSKKHVDFSEMEEIRLKGPRSPEKLSRLSKHRDFRESSPMKSRDGSPAKLEPLTSKSRMMRYVDSSCSFKSDSALMESPIFRGRRPAALLEQHKKVLNSLSLEDERQYKHHVPKHLPRKYQHNSRDRSMDPNFGLQISRTQTVVAPLSMDAMEPSDKMAQLRRYAATHNPSIGSSVKPDRAEKLKPIKSRHVSIPTGRPDSPKADDIDQLYVGGPVVAPGKKSGGAMTWNDRSDFERVPGRKMAAAGIVKMYLANSDVVGSIEHSLYSTINDRNNQGDPLLDGDPFIVQPLLKTKLKASVDASADHDGVELPKIAMKPMADGASDHKERFREKMCVENDNLDLSITNASKMEHVDTRVS